MLAEGVTMYRQTVRALKSYGKKIENYTLKCAIVIHSKKPFYSIIELFICHGFNKTMYSKKTSIFFIQQILLINNKIFLPSALALIPPVLGTILHFTLEPMTFQYVPLSVEMGGHCFLHKPLALSLLFLLPLYLMLCGSIYFFIR